MNYCRLSLRPKESVLNLVKTIADEPEDNWWDDEVFITELNRRTAKYEAGKAKVYTLDRMEAKIRKEHKSSLQHNTPDSRLKTPNSLPLQLRLHPLNTVL